MEWVRKGQLAGEARLSGSCHTQRGKVFGEEDDAGILREIQALGSSAVCWEISSHLYQSDHKCHQLRMSEKVT